MPLTPLQADVLRALARNRSPESYLAGGIALNRFGTRFSVDIDVFQDRPEALATSVDDDAAVLVAAGFRIERLDTGKTGKFEIEVRRDGEKTRLDYVADSDFRFFPVLPDPEFGFVLHPIDLATNKASAAAARREARDTIDLITIHERILPLGAVIAATVGRFPGESPEYLLEMMRFNGRLTLPDFETLAFDGPVDRRAIGTAIRTMFDAAEIYLSKLPSDEVGVVFLDGDRVVQPEPGTWSRYTRHEGRKRGHWPSSPEIARGMLRRYTTSPPGA